MGAPSGMSEPLHVSVCHALVDTQGELHIIDVSQSVDLDHPKALDFLKEDCKHVNDFFRRKGTHSHSHTHADTNKHTHRPPYQTIAHTSVYLSHKFWALRPTQDTCTYGGSHTFAPG